jgi:serine/threonine protein kinase
MLHAACLHVQMLSGNPPFSNLSNPMAILFKISRSTAPPPFPAGISSACADFLTLCFRLKPAERPSARELLEHRFLSFSDRESES